MKSKSSEELQYVPMTSRLGYRRRIDFCCPICHKYESEVGCLMVYRRKNNKNVIILCPECEQEYVYTVY